ncbi:hypothetical protein [Succinivibrio dextrinosolvens]|uniref:hypothetical protein n=1 Tax=Succinivibrio dextrinosolvens TaxID=83771 RepID=UPI00247986E1|nr:hypothetical protein [Succinivibrio dextrinosolvens]
MDVATSTISNLGIANIPHAAQEARRDSIARESIPQINHIAKSLNTQPNVQGNAQLAPANANLYVQAETIIKTGQEKKGISKKQSKGKVQKEAQGGNTAATEKIASSTSTLSGNTLNQNVSEASGVKAALGGSFGSTGATYSKEADTRREKGEGFSSKVIADTYNSIIPDNSKGQQLDIEG